MTVYIKDRGLIESELAKTRERLLSGRQRELLELCGAIRLALRPQLLSTTLSNSSKTSLKC